MDDLAATIHARVLDWPNNAGGEWFDCPIDPTGFNQDEPGTVSPQEAGYG